MSQTQLLATTVCCFAALFGPDAFLARVPAADRAGLELFEKRIRPALVRYCYECHSAATRPLKGGLQLDSRDGIRTGGETGPAVVPGKVSDSLLIAAIRHESLEMPPDVKLPDALVAEFVKWIELGAPDPRDHPPSANKLAELSWQAVLDDRRDWWSLQPVRSPQVPLTADSSWSDHPVDRFVLSQLELAGLDPAGEAEPPLLLRRLSLLLTGLPPTPDEVAEFEAEMAQNPTIAREILVDRLLESPHFGERWARHWMDVVRFAETHGYEWNHEIRDAWQYRDYLIRAFNNDIPYDQLVREHVAGDLLEQPRINEQLQINESVIGTAFWRFGELGHDDCVQFPEIRFDALDNQIDTFTKAFQASTVSCARCHDHKFDAISTRDYYALAGIVESSRQVVQTVDRPERIVSQAQRLERIKREIRSELAGAWLQAVDSLAGKISAELTRDAPVDGKAEQKTLSTELARSDLTPDNPVSVLRKIAALTTGDAIRTAWRKAANEYREQHAAQCRFNAENFETFWKSDAGDSNGWTVSGLGPTQSPSPPGEFVVQPSGRKAVSSVLPGGIYTHLLSSRLNGTIGSPWMPGDRKHTSIQFIGGGLSMIRAVVDSCALNEFVGGGLEYLSNDELQWRTYPTRVDSSHRAFLELTTKSDNVRWPDRPGVAGKDEALLASSRSWFGVVRAVVHDCDESPRPELGHLLPLFDQPEPASLSDVAARFRSVCAEAVVDWRDNQASDHDVQWINWMLSVELLPNSTTHTARLASLVQEYRNVESNIPQPRVVAGMADLGAGFASPVLLRGNPLNPGPPEPRRYLEVVVGSTSPLDTVGSGRRELAELIASPDNPLTARVMVNRIWHHLFGSGLVTTTDDFGRLGDRPSHPALLDFLASRFVNEGWSVKRLIRQIVTSRTFRQSGVSTATGLEVDPRNRLLHHFPVRRLGAEAIRDTILAVSGRLDRKRFGPSIQPFRAEPKEHRKLHAGPLDGDGRRSVYLKVTRMEGPRFLELFDLPDQTETRGRRDRTNVPAQALALLNDPFVIDQSRAWGESLVARGDETMAERIDYVFLRALSRSPHPRERDRMLGFVNRLAQIHGVKPTGEPSSREIWQDVAHAMFNMKEMIYIR